MSPEQAAGDLDRLGPRPATSTAWGRTLYCLLTGTAAVRGRRPRRGAAAGPARATSRRPRELDPSIDPALEAVCLKAMALEPEDRYAIAAALADDVERWLADEPVSAWREPLARAGPAVGAAAPDGGDGGGGGAGRSRSALAAVAAVQARPTPRESDRPQRSEETAKRDRRLAQSDGSAQAEAAERPSSARVVPRAPTPAPRARRQAARAGTSWSTRGRDAARAGVRRVVHGDPAVEADVRDTLGPDLLVAWATGR